MADKDTDALGDLERVLKQLRNHGAREDQLTALMQDIKQALIDGVAAIEGSKPATAPDFGPALAQAMAGLKFPAPQITVTPEVRSDWNSLEVYAPVDQYGRPTGRMTITKVK